MSGSRAPAAARTPVLSATEETPGELVLISHISPYLHCLLLHPKVEAFSLLEVYLLDVLLVSEVTHSVQVLTSCQLF